MVSATLLHISTPTSSAKQQQQQLATRGNGAASTTTTNNQLQNDLLTANFYSINGGKTSARRIVQQPNFGVSNSTNLRAPFLATGEQLNRDEQQTNDRNSSPKKQELDNVESPKEEAAGNNEAIPSGQNEQNGTGSGNLAADIVRIENGGQMNDRQQTNEDSNLVQSSVAGNISDDLNSDQLGANGENSLTQQQMMINSLNSLVGNGAHDDFVSSTAPAFTPVSSGRQQQQQQQQQSTTNSQFVSNRDDSPAPPTPSTTPSGDQQQQQQNQFQDSSSSIATADSTTEVPTTFLVDSSSSQAANKLVMQPLNQQPIQFTTSTGTPISSQNSISMSLDEMIVNSRPRSSNQQQSLDSGTTLNIQRNEGMKIKQNLVPQSRIGELSNGDNSKLRRENLRNSQADNNFNGQQNTAKASRRVPYSGVTFSSPVTKGQRTKPKASNQVGGAFGNLPQQQQVGIANGVSGPQAADLMAGLQLKAAQPPRPLSGQLTNKLNDFRQVLKNPDDQVLSEDFAQKQQHQQQDQQNDMQLLQGFDEDQQQIQHQRQNNINPIINNKNFNSNVNLDSNTLEVMRNIINNPTLRNQQNSKDSSPDDMVMSLMSSADGKERRLVMIARDTLDSLQRFAAQNQQMGLQPQQSPLQQQQMQTSSRSKTSQRQNKKQNDKTSKQQQAARGSDSNANGANWWPNGAGQNIWAPNLSTGGQQQQNSMFTSTLSPSSQRNSMTQQQEAQQEVQLQTTTLAPLPFSGSAPTRPPPTTSITTQLPNFSSVTTTQSTFTQESSSPGSFENAKDSLQSDVSTSNNQNQAKSNGSDSFREVPVISSLVVAKESSGSDEQQAQQQVSRGSNGQISSIKQMLGNKSKSSDGKIVTAAGDKSNGVFKQQSGSVGNARNRVQSANAGKTGGKKRTNGSNSSPSQAGKQSASGGKQIDSSNKENSKGSNGLKSKSNGHSQGAKKGSSRKTTTNGQQQISANRANEQQQQTKRPFLNLSEDFSTTPATTTTTTTTTTTLSPTTSFQTNSQNSPDQSSTTDQQVQDQQIVSSPKQPTPTNTTTTRATPTSSSISQQQFTTTQESLADGNELGEQQQQQQVDDSGLTFGGDQQQQQRRVRPSNDAYFDRKIEDYGSRTHSGSFDSHSSGPQTDADRLDALRAAIPGEPQLDYPIYASPPKTSFDCMSQSCPGGYYADLETQCQAFHICQNDGRFDTFLCPNGTIFSQQHFVCVWWWQVDCQQSATFYKLNDGIYCNSMFPAASLPSSSPSGLVSSNDASGTSTLSNGSTGNLNKTGGGNNSNLLVDTQRNNGTNSK